jgi:WD40 repeat protein
MEFKTDPNGYIIWEYYNSPADSILAMTTAKTGEPILLCAGPDQQLKLIYLDKSGKKSSEKIYMSIPNLIVQDMSLRPTGDILAFGSEDRNAVIINLSKSGALQKVLSFAADSPSSVQSLVMLPDNTAIVLIATGTESTGTDVVVLKMSPDI